MPADELVTALTDSRLRMFRVQYLYHYQSMNIFPFFESFKKSIQASLLYTCYIAHNWSSGKLYTEFSKNKRKIRESHWSRFASSFFWYGRQDSWVWDTLSVSLDMAFSCWSIWFIIAFCLIILADRSSFLYALSASTVRAFKKNSASLCEERLPVVTGCSLCLWDLARVLWPVWWAWHHLLLRPK